jgi:NAD-dependent dihydropyrimidine dehydrogenase PreA subunit
MAYVIGQACIGEKRGECVPVCPVDCIHPTPDEPGYASAEQLYINPDECIDCEACKDACPVNAISHEEFVSADLHRFIDLNAAFYR